MNTLNISDKDELTMRLVHYFVTKEDYQPIIVAGLENEIWLENMEKPYEIIRINSNYIHNAEQLDFDNFKANTVIKQVKKKTLSLSCDTLNILINVGENVSLDELNQKHMEFIKIDSVKDLETESGLVKLFPEILNDKVESENIMDFFINVTDDINETTEKKNQLYEKTFSKKPILITYILIAINCIIFFLQVAGILDYSQFGMTKFSVKAGEIYRLFTAAFFHANIYHLLANMYSLYIIGSEVENVLGKVRYICIYFISIIVASLLSGVLNNSLIPSIGASGAIFGLLGALLYFGYHYRLYLGNALIYRIIPIIAINLFLGFSLKGMGIDNFAHIGGLIGGIFATMIVGIQGRKDVQDKVNGFIVLSVLIGFLLYMTFFR